MSVQQKTDTYPACHGIACAHHARCARWQAVQGSEADPNTMGTCVTNDGYPEFIEIKRSPLSELAAEAGHA